MSRYRAILEYDGTCFHGYQRQANARTVQGDVEAALSILNEDAPVTVYGAGRTDSGVHATGQVIAFNLAWRHGVDKLTRALNAHLSRDVAVREIACTDNDFHPRFAARCRRYEYHIYNAPFRSPLRRRVSWRVWPKLDLRAMQNAAQVLIGKHDFATFGTAPEPGGQTVRTVRKTRWQEQGPLLIFEIEADAFLHRMVRSIVGTLRQVGSGEMTSLDVTERLAAAQRKLSGPTAPPQGLRLVEVMY